MTLEEELVVWVIYKRQDGEPTVRKVRKFKTFRSAVCGKICVVWPGPRIISFWHPEFEFSLAIQREVYKVFELQDEKVLLLFCGSQEGQLVEPRTGLVVKVKLPASPASCGSRSDGRLWMLCARGNIFELA